MSRQAEKSGRDLECGFRSAVEKKDEVKLFKGHVVVKLGLGNVTSMRKLMLH